MGRLREIPRTAAFAWSSDITNPSIATGTRAGAVDVDFSGETKLELWNLDLGNRKQDVEIQPAGSLNTESRFYDLAWSPPTSDHPDGIIAGALETGSLDLWDAAKLKTDPSNALVSRTTKHSGAIKAIQFNPHRPELLASSGAKGEVFITNLNDPENPSRLGVAAARADDIDALDWNKKVPHIMATAGSGGFVTVWDVKERKERLTLNNYGRKAVSAVAWDPDLPTKLATAVASDQDPLILVWDLRNSSAPERILRGHEQGVLSLSWCGHDTDLLLSCGKDNRNICWNPHAGEIVGEFPIVTNWTFQTRWNPRHPTLLATASFDGKVVVQTTQSTNAPSSEPGAGRQAADGADFFASSEIQPQTSSFSLPKPPKWLKRPIGASFGFGGKLVRFSTTDEQPHKSTLRIETFASDSGVDSSISSFQSALKTNDLSQLCESKISAAQTETNKNDWKIMQTLFSDAPRKGLLTYLGFADIKVHHDDGTESTDEIGNLVAPQQNAQINGVKDNSHKRLSSFFDGTSTINQDFLGDLAASKGGRTNNPFEIYTGSESEADTEITRAIILGSFEEAMDICLREKRMSEAFMIAICGGQKCIDKAQAAYFAQSSNGPNYLRLLESVVGKNLWDVVYNANLDNWADVMATVCTYADENEFPDLCEALGDRLEEFNPDRKDATFCYLAGSKLEKLVPIWVREMQDAERSRSEAAGDESAFSIHVDALQNLVEKVTIFRRATRYEDKDVQDKKAVWRLESLYSIYAEYADVVASYGYLDLAEQYLSLLPTEYPAADVARNRVRRATQKVSTTIPSRTQAAATTTRAATKSSAYGPGPSVAGPGMVAPVSTAPGLGAPGPSIPAQPPYSAIPPRLAQSAYQPNLPQPSSPYAPAGSSPYAPTTPFGAQQYQPSPAVVAPSETGQNGPPPPRNAQLNGSNWNDLPDAFAQKQPTSRRGTPGPAGVNAIRSPFINQPEVMAIPPPPVGRMQTPLPPPPKAGSPHTSIAPQGMPQPPPTSSSAASMYGPSTTAQTLPPPQPFMPRGPSPYNAPPTGAAAGGSGRYAPAPGTPASPGLNAGPPSARVIAPNPYAQPPAGQPITAPRSSQPPNFAQPPPPRAAPPPTGPPPRGNATQPPPQAQYTGPTGPPSYGAPPPVQQASAPPPVAAPPAPAPVQHPAGDRSHIAPNALPIYQTLETELQRIKGLAPANFKQHVDDTDRRLSLLFDALNNGQIAPDVVNQLISFALALGARNFDQALEIHTQLLMMVEQSPPWMVGLKRFISMSRATPL